MQIIDFYAKKTVGDIAAPVAQGNLNASRFEIDITVRKNRFVRVLRERLFLCSLLTALVLSLSGLSDALAADLRPFTSDGCSFFPDGTIKDRAKWCDCCLNHDIAYWQGGTEEKRKKADESLRDCVLERTKDKNLAETMYLGVRAGGHPAFPNWYRWAYGWPYGRGYKPLSDAETQRVKERLDEYGQKHPEGYCGKTHPHPILPPEGEGVEDKDNSIPLPHPVLPPVMWTPCTPASAVVTGRVQAKIILTVSRARPRSPAQVERRILNNFENPKKAICTEMSITDAKYYG